MIEVQPYIVVGGAIAALSLWPLIYSVRRLERSRGHNWPTAAGVVTDSYLTEEEKPEVEVDYRYEVDGVSYQGYAVAADPSPASPADSEALLERYAAGTEVAVHYDPARPSSAVLIPGVDSRAARTLLPLTLSSMFVGLIFLADGIAIQAASSPDLPTSRQEVAIADQEAPTGIANADLSIYGCDSGPRTEPSKSQPISRQLTGRLRESQSNRSLTPGWLNAPVGLAIGKSGTFYITDHDSVGTGGRLWILQLGKSPIFDALNLSGLKPVLKLGSPGGVAVDSSGTVYLTEPDSGRVLRLDPNPTAVTEVFKVPDDGSATDVAIDGAANIYVSDTKNSRVWKVSAGGGSPTRVPAEFLSHPQGLAVDSKGALYVVDSGNNRVLKFAPDLNSATEVPFTGLKNPYDVAVGQGSVYVTDQGNGRTLMVRSG